MSNIMKPVAADNEGEDSFSAELETFHGHDKNGSPLPVATTISREEHEQAIHKVKAELSETKNQCDELHRQLMKKDKEANHAKQEVETLKKLMKNHSTSMVATVQRDHAVAAVTEKDMILQRYKTLIDSLNEELKKSRTREEKAIKALKNGMDILLRESMAAAQTRKRNEEPAEDALAPSNLPPIDLLDEDLENCPPVERTGGVTKELETQKAAEYM